MSELDIQKDKYPLHKFDHSVRATQLAVQYGVGAMIDFPEQTLMTAAPEYWEESTKVIYDDRLAKMLHVKHFAMPTGNQGERVSYVRFPEWYFCPKCRKFQPIKQWVKEYQLKAKQKVKDNDPYMVNHPRCPVDHVELVVTRIVCVCENGHISDFPWVEWCHARNTGGARDVCANPQLTFSSGSTSSEGLESLTVKCSCGATANLGGAFDSSAFLNLDRKFGGKYDFHCKGLHPWKHTHETCACYPIAQQRGSSSVYFPVMSTSLVIPPYSEKQNIKIEKSKAFEKLKIELEGSVQNLLKFNFPPDKIEEMKQSIIADGAKKIAIETSLNEDQVLEILKRKWEQPKEQAENITTESNKYRAEEYIALSGEIQIPEKDQGDFQTETTKIDEYGLPFLKRVTLINKIREVDALTGFTRIKPAETDINGEPSKRIVSIKQPETKWYPAYEVRGEGIFLEFKSDNIEAWAKAHPEVEERAKALTENYNNSYWGKNNPKTITAKYLLLHTISHLLIKQLSFECGYVISSLKERLYSSVPGEETEMAGILIYTASGDSEGTLGGLVRQGRSDVFPAIFKKAISEAVLCSNDPVCSLSKGQGRDSLNLAACHSCALIPETSCEKFNIFLDRGVVVGTFDNRKMGFFPGGDFDNNYGGSSNKGKDPIPNPPPPKPETDLILDVKGGTNLSSKSYEDIWKSRITMAEDADIAVYKTLIEAGIPENLEKPYMNCSIEYIDPKNAQKKKKIKCELVWKSAKVLLFSLDNDNYLETAKKSDWTCLFLQDPGFNADSLIKVLSK